MASHNFDDILLSTIRDKVEAVFGYRPCLWQLKVVRAILKRDKDVASIAATGSGKTLTFWMPLLFIENGIQIVITPLNILGKQNVESLAKVGISTICITAETATEENFQAIAEGRHRAIVTNIETLMKPDGGFSKLWNDKDFMSKVISVVWDEAQCISKWGDFRPEYKTAGTLRNFIPHDIPFYITSATLPPDVLHDVMAILGMRETKTEIFMRSNDRSNIHLTVRKMKYAMNSFKDLAFLIPPDWDPSKPLPYKFTIFFDSITESLAAAQYLRSLLPLEHRDKIKWFNSEMSPEFRAEEADKFNEGHTFGLACTESFGMGIDMPNITLVIQWRATCDMCTLWQRFGRGARDPECEAIALFLVEPMYFDETKEEKAIHKAKRDERAAELRTASSLGKRARTARDDGPRPTKKSRSDGVATSASAAVTASTPLTPLTDLHSRFIASPPRSRQTAPHPSSGTTSLPQLSGPAVLDMDLASDDSEPEDAAVALEDRRAAYRRGKSVVKKKKDGNELSPEVDDMINAGSESRQINCYRVPPRLYFGSDKTTSDHKACRTDLPDGCPRCVSKTPPIYCELCTPSHFESFAIVDLPKPAPVPSRSRLKAYKAEGDDMTLRDALHGFRLAATIAKFGHAVLKNNGPGMVLSNEVLQRIVDCAHQYKIQSTEQLMKETRWAGTGEFGAEVLELINIHRPIPKAPDPPAAAPLVARDDNILATPSLKPFQGRKCSKCGVAGHNVSNQRFHPRIPHVVAAVTSPSREFTSPEADSADQNNIPTSPRLSALPSPSPRSLYQPYTPAAPFSPFSFRSPLPRLACTTFTPFAMPFLPPPLPRPTPRPAWKNADHPDDRGASTAPWASTSSSTLPPSFEPHVPTTPMHRMTQYPQNPEYPIDRTPATPQVWNPHSHRSETLYSPFPLIPAAQSTVSPSQFYDFSRSRKR
ncbi:P-loop containing nucleoside triphosphate hydrolase protein [Mycena rebaudengoi]|nr:P-loop containing nucleoside triphosphate hydrolase protein [Mycena rebaudengoi]